MNVLFINTNLNGHFNPTLPLMGELAARGNRVECFCSERFRAAAEQAGAKWIDFTPELKDFLGAYRPTDRHPFYMLTEYMLL